MVIINHIWFLTELSQSTEDELALVDVDVPLYSLNIFDNFTTVNDEDLDAKCSQDYQLTWQLKAVAMVTTLNDEIAVGNLCPGGDDKFTVISSTTNLFTYGNKVCIVFSQMGPSTLLVVTVKTPHALHNNVTLELKQCSCPVCELNLNNIEINLKLSYY